MPTGWRIVKSRYADAAFDGEGARLYGGRWNSVGTGMIYTAQSQALAILEVLVHLEKAGVLSSYSLCAAHFEEDLAEALEPAAVPDDWRGYPPPSELRVIGDAWVAEQTSAVLQVPSVLVEDESNYLINPAHPDFPSITIGEPRPFEFDVRLLG
jgi:RES domain-containing protein